MQSQYDNYIIFFLLPLPLPFKLLQLKLHTAKK